MKDDSHSNGATKKEMRGGGIAFSALKPGGASMSGFQVHARTGKGV